MNEVLGERGREAGKGVRWWSFRDREREDMKGRGKGMNGRRGMLDGQNDAKLKMDKETKAEIRECIG